MHSNVVSVAILDMVIILALADSAQNCSKVKNSGRMGRGAWAEENRGFAQEGTPRRDPLGHFQSIESGHW
jgi:hypothetical protein